MAYGVRLGRCNELENPIGIETMKFDTLYMELKELQRT